MRAPELVLPRIWFDRVIAKAEDTAWRVCPLGQSHLEDCTQLLAAEPLSPYRQRAAQDDLFMPRSRLFMRLSEGGEGRLVPPMPPSYDAWNMVLEVGIGESQGDIRAHVVGPDGEVFDLSRICLPGPEFVRLDLQGGTSIATDRERWSRSQGALGLRAWEAYANASVGIVGCGRLGTTLALTMARNGARRLVLCDPDLVERSNLGESDLFEEYDIGRPKAVAAQAALAMQAPWCQAVSAVGDVASEAVANALKGCDVLVCVADTARARFVTGLLAVAFQKPLLDIGTGIFRERGRRVLGIDVRLIVPGSGCLNDYGGPGEATDGVAWSDQRAGSLRSLNHMAVGLGLMQLERLACGDIGRSAWNRLTITGSVEPDLDDMSRQHNASCLCRYTGIGDEVFWCPSWPR
ncbi:MAG: ThiF family adenylyltransferase [Fimbriimonas sp.]